MHDQTEIDLSCLSDMDSDVLIPIDTTARGIKGELVGLLHAALLLLCP